MKTEKKEKTIEVLDVMIQHADKGPSGFWVDDYEGCGNPQIFPEFEDGLKRGKLIKKNTTYVRGILLLCTETDTAIFTLAATIVAPSRKQSFCLPKCLNPFSIGSSHR